MAFLFPGQGSQRSGMGETWVDHPSWEITGEASAQLDIDFEHLLLRATQEELTLTKNAQLATYVLSLTILDAVERVGISPIMCAGHSLGEYTALTASGAIGFDDGLELVAARGEAMHEASTEQPGTMAAVIGLNEDDVSIACHRANGDVWVANYNAPSQVVIAGDTDAIDRASEIALEMGAKKVLRFPVSGAFHTPFMIPARDNLQKAIDATAFRDLEVPVYANVDGRAHLAARDWPALLVSQLCSPVRFRQMIERMHQEDATLFVELGPGGVLSGLVKRILPGARTMTVATPDDLDKLVEFVMHTPDTMDWRREHQGEYLFVSERLVVSPATGLFTPSEVTRLSASENVHIEVGAVVGFVGGEEIRSPFAGVLMGSLALPGERITNGQPVAWLRSQVS